MADSIYLLQSDGSLTAVTQAPYAQERDLQELLDRHPELLPGALINPDEPRRWLVLRWEADIPAEEGGSPWWSLDHLLLDQDGVPTFVEVKRSSDTRIRREVVAQMLEYAANGTAYWRVEGLRAWFEESQRDAGSDPERTLADFMGEELVDVEAFWSRVQENLQASRVRCIFVADEIPASLRRLVEFLNEHLDTVEVLAVELPQYVAPDAGVRALVPRVVGQTARAQAAKGNRPRTGRQWDEENFMAAVREQHGPPGLQLCRAIQEWCRVHEVEIAWGKGAQDGSMVAVIRAAGVVYKPFSLWTYGTIEVSFEYLKSRPAFASEERRRELLQRLNAVPGIQLPADSLSRRPNIPFQDLARDESLTGFLAVMEWVVGVIRQAG